jgi:hypothetical protein
MPRRAARVILGGHVVHRVHPVRQRQALSHGHHVHIADEALRDDAIVSIDDTLVAGDGSRADQILKRERGLLTAAVHVARGVETGLPALGRVDPLQPNTLAMYLDVVAVDHLSDAHDVRPDGDGPEQEHCRHQEMYGASQSSTQGHVSRKAEITPSRI